MDASREEEEVGSFLSTLPRHLLRGVRGGRTGRKTVPTRFFERTRILITAFALTVLWAGAAWGQGPVALLGIDPEDCGLDGAHGPIENYEALVSDVLLNVANGGSGILVFGPNGACITAWWNQIVLDLSDPNNALSDPNNIPVSVTFVNGATNITNQSFAGFALLVVSSDTVNMNQSAGAGTGGLTNAENDALGARSADVASFVNGGGGLLGFTSNLNNPYAYLADLGTFTFNHNVTAPTGTGYQDITPTPEGALIGITDDLDLCCWHAEFLTFPSFLEVLATNAGNTNASAIGGLEVMLSLCGNGLTDPNEACDDGNVLPGDCCSATCEFEASGSACGDASDTVCDNPDTCDGAGACQDNNEPGTTVCRAVAGVCDVEELCDGAGSCPADGFVSAGTECLAAAGVCDVAEECTGSSATCPADGANLTSECRASAGICDVAESCSDASDNCPADGFQPDGTSCDDSNVCTTSDECTGGVCQGDLNTCGDGIVQNGTCGEECDDGNTNNGDCCSSICQFEASGSGCGDPSDTECDNPDTCDGAGTCDINNEADASVCGDQGVDCLEDDECAAGSCQDNGFASIGTPCDVDADLCTNDECDGGGLCLFRDDVVCPDELCAVGACNPGTGICFLDPVTPCCGNDDNETGEDCDGTDDLACPGTCFAPGHPNECLCVSPDCGDGFTDPNKGEQCDPPLIPPDELCDNDIDDDGDGLVDCEDPDCPAFCKYNGMLDPNAPFDINEPCMSHRDCRLKFGTSAQCLSQGTCGFNCLLTNMCSRIDRDPARIRFGTKPGQLDFLLVHGRFVIQRVPNPTTEGVQVSLSNDDGMIFAGMLLPGEMTLKGKNYVFKDKTAKELGGIMYVRMKFKMKRGSLNMIFKVKAYGDLSAATGPLMTFRLSSGTEGAFQKAEWTEWRKGWILYFR